MLPAERNPFLPPSSASESSPETLRSVVLPPSGVRSHSVPASWTESVSPPSSVDVWDVVADDEDAPITRRTGTAPVVDRAAERFRDSLVVQHDRRERERAIFASVLEPAVEVERIFGQLHAISYPRQRLVARAKFLEQVTKGCDDHRLQQLHDAIGRILAYLRSKKATASMYFGAKKALIQWLDDVEADERADQLHAKLAQRPEDTVQPTSSVIPYSESSEFDDDSHYPSEGVL